MFGKPGKPGKQIAPAPTPAPHGRTVPGNGQAVTVTVYGPDQWSRHLATGMAVGTLTFSPMAAGRHTSGTSRGYSGDPGYGVNRFAGRTPPRQAFAGAAAAVAPVADPKSRRLGIGAGVAGQPGLPNTGADAGGLAALAWMGYTQLGRTAMGG